MDQSHGRRSQARPRARAAKSAGQTRPDRERRGRASRGAAVRRLSRLSRRRGLQTFQRGAQMRLRRFRQGSLLAVSITALILLVWGVPAASGQEPEPVEEAPLDVPADPIDALTQGVETIRELVLGSYALLPKLLIAAAILLLAALAGKAATWVLRKTLRQWERGEAIAALTRIGLYLLAIAAGLSVIAGDARALLGSIGLVGLALSWALQTPIESFTGWLLNSFRGYYKIGDRIEVGEVFGDVYRIDVLTTTVWEAGGPGKSVAGAQPTGAMITFPNWEVLRSNIVNYSRDFPFVWDEVVVSVTNESDVPFAMSVFEKAAHRVIGERMAGAAAQYQELLQRARIAFDISGEPEVFVTPAESWTDCTIRYLVHARERRRWATALHLALAAEASRPEHAGRIVPAYPRSEVLLRQSWKPERDES